MGAFIDLTGEVAGRLTVLSRASNAGKHTRWNCVCDCGTETVVYADALRSGNTRSCGCLKTENAGGVPSHGMVGTPTYKSWEAMMARCYSPSRESYPRYGGLGVLVCEEWHHFSGFFASMGVRPSGKTLDRKENSKGYNPENCRWATPKEQALNRGRSIRVVLAGEVVSLPDAATKLGVSYWRLYREIKSGNSKLELSK